MHFVSWLVGSLKCKECGSSVIIDMQKKSPTNIHRYLADSGWLTVNKYVGRKFSIRIDDVENQVFGALQERIKMLEIAHKQKETPDIETESIKELHSKKVGYPDSAGKA